MTRVYFMRHGETDWNRDGNRYCGRTDIGLSAEGKRQASAAADWLTDIRFDRIVASPLRRAVDTAETIARGRGMDVECLEEVRELDYGLWEGMTLTNIQRTYPEDWEAWYERPEHTPAGRTGESAAEVGRRYVQALESLLSGCDREEERILVVGHSAAIRIMFARVLGMPFAAYRTMVLHNTGVCVLEKTSGGEARMLQFNGRPHAL